MGVKLSRKAWLLCAVFLMTHAGQSLAGKKLLIWGEQGVGDEVMYATMITDVLALGADITFETDSRLVPLFERSCPEIKCVARHLEPVYEIQKTKL